MSDGEGRDSILASSVSGFKSSPGGWVSGSSPWPSSGFWPSSRVVDGVLPRSIIESTRARLPRHIDIDMRDGDATRWMREARVTDRTHHPIPGPGIPPPRVTLTRFGERANQQRRARRFGSLMRIGAATAPRHAIVALISRLGAHGQHAGAPSPRAVASAGYRRHAPIFVKTPGQQHHWIWLGEFDR